VSYCTCLSFLRIACKDALRNYNRLSNPGADEPEQLNDLEEVFRKAAKTDTPTDVRHLSWIMFTFGCSSLDLTVLFIIFVGSGPSLLQNYT
jgi:hypothetical protein